MAPQKPNRTNPPSRSPNGLDPCTLGNESTPSLSRTTSSMYNTNCSPLHTPSLAIRADDDEITSLGRIKKRNSLLLQRSRSPDIPLHIQEEVVQSPFTPLSETTRERKHADVPADSLYAGADKQSLHLPRSSIKPLQDPSRMYQYTRASHCSNDLLVSQDRRRSVLSRKVSSTSSPGHLAENTWEQASGGEKKNVKFKENDEIRSLPESKEKGAISRSFRRGVDRVKGMDRQDTLASSITDYIADVGARHPSLQDHKPYRSSPLASLGPHSPCGPSPIIAGPHTPRDTRYLPASSKKPYRTAHNIASSPALSNKSFQSTPPSFRNHATRSQYNDEDVLRTPSSLLSKRSSSGFSPSPLFGHFPTRNRSSERSIEFSSPSPAYKTSVSQKLDMASNTLKIMQPQTTYSQKPVLGSPTLSVMAPLTIISQAPIPSRTDISITAPITVFSQAPTPAEDTLIWLFISFILPLLLATSQTLAFAINNVDEEMSKELSKMMFYGYLMGMVLGIILLACFRGLTRVPEDIAFFLAHVLGVMLGFVRRVIGKISEGFEAGNAATVEET